MSLPSCKVYRRRKGIVALIHKAESESFQSPDAFKKSPEWVDNLVQHKMKTQVVHGTWASNIPENLRHSFVTHGLSVMADCDPFCDRLLELCEHRNADRYPDHVALQVGAVFDTLVKASGPLLTRLIQVKRDIAALISGEFVGLNEAPHEVLQCSQLKIKDELHALEEFQPQRIDSVLRHVWVLASGLDRGLHDVRDGYVNDLRIFEKVSLPNSQAEGLSEEREAWFKIVEGNAKRRIAGVDSVYGAYKRVYNPLCKSWQSY